MGLCVPLFRPGGTKTLGVLGYAGFAETGTGAYVRSGGLCAKPVSRSATATYPEAFLSAQES